MDNKKILVIEDDESLGESILTFLKDDGHNVTLSGTLTGAREVLGKNSFDLVVLDWMLPDGQGIDFLREIRSSESAKIKSMPIIMLTARADLIDKILGLETGANDYMTKPFEPREFLARIRVQFRTKVQGNDDKTGTFLVYGDLTINSDKREVLYADVKLDLTKMEYELLKLLVEYPSKSFSREELLNKVWGFDKFPTTRTVDTHVSQLRQKISEDFIETVWGFGYKVKDLP